MGMNFLVGCLKVPFLKYFFLGLPDNSVAQFISQMALNLPYSWSLFITTFYNSVVMLSSVLFPALSTFSL